MVPSNFTFCFFLAVDQNLGVKQHAATQATFNFYGKDDRW